MEFVEGPTLADRIAADTIPVDEALPIARQIAEALEAALMSWELFIAISNPRISRLEPTGQ